MANLRALPLGVLAGALLCSTALSAQQFAATSRIVNRIDENNLVALKGNTHPAANAGNDRGRVSPDLPMTDLILVLSRDPAQQAAFEKFVASQYDQNSPNFHQWLSPQQVGTNFGPSEADIAAVSNWLTGHGFAVTQVTNDRMTIRFSGTAAQVESAFHTQIHNLVVNGEAHIGNISDPQIPAALAPVIVGIKSLHNFFPKPLHHMGNLVTKDSKTGQWARTTGAAAANSTASPSATAGIAPRALVGGASAGSAPAIGTLAAHARPEFGISGTFNGSPYLVEDIGPYDFATIYNVLPLWKAGIDGSGQTIAIAGTSSIVLNDVATFRNFFLPSYTSTPAPVLISGNSSPVTVCKDTTGLLPYPNNPCTLNDLLENSLDVEWSGAVAPKAQIVLVSSYPSSATDDGLFDSESYIVNHLTARIMNVSYGACELFLGTAGNVQYYNLWQTAAAEGIAVFVASGDSGAASCDAGGDGGGSNLPAPAKFGLSVSGIASTPYNTAVGGTDFNWCALPTSSTSPECTAAPYWSSTNTGNANAPESSALGYVPEVPWNDTCTSPVALPFMEYFWNAVSNGAVTVSDAETSCNAFVVNANTLSQIGDRTYLYFADTIGGSGGGSGCVASSTTTTIGACTTGATSTGATTSPDTGAAQASLPLFNNGWIKPTWQTGVAGIPSDGVRDLPDVSFFASDGFLSNSAYLICVSNATVDSQCAYSSNQEPNAQEVGGTSVATPAMAAVMALINQKTGADQGSPNTELYKLAASQTYSSCSAESVTAGSSSCYFNDIDKGTNAMACDYSASVTTPSPNCTRLHSSDFIGILSGYSATTGYDLATGLGSLNVANVVNAWPAVQGAAAATVTVTPGQLSINSSNSLSVTVTVASTASGGTVPSGTVTLTAGGSTYTSTQTLSGAGTATFTIPANSLPGSPAPGQADTLTGTYSGDALYAKVSNNAQVTVTALALLTPTVKITPASTTLNSGASLGVSVTVSGPTGTSIVPTGTDTLTAGSYNSGAQALVNGAFSFTIPANTLSAGPDSINVAYNGDSNYAAVSSSVNVTVTASTFTLSQPAVVVSPSTIAPGASAMATVTVAAVAGYTGTVTLSCVQSSTTATGGDGATCSGGGTASVVTLTGANTGTVTFTAGTSPKVGALVYPDVHGKGQEKELAGLGIGAVLAFLVFLGIPARRRSWRQMLGVLALIAALGGLSSCGGGSVSNGGGGQTDPGTTAGTYTFTVQATGTPTVTPTVTTTFSVVVN